MKEPNPPPEPKRPTVTPQVQVRVAPVSPAADPEPPPVPPEGWTDDMRIALAPEAHAALVELIFSQLLAFAQVDEACRQIRTRFHLSEEDAHLALDRVPGGVIRALFGTPENRPDPRKDPLAHLAFEKVWSELPRKHFFSRRRKPTGRWLAWFEELRRRENNGGQAAPPAAP